MMCSVLPYRPQSCHKGLERFPGPCTEINSGSEARNCAIQVLVCQLLPKLPEGCKPSLRPELHDRCLKLSIRPSIWPFHSAFSQSIPCCINTGLDYFTGLGSAPQETKRESGHISEVTECRFFSICGGAGKSTCKFLVLSTFQISTL